MVQIEPPGEEPPLQHAKQANPGQMWRPDMEALSSTERWIMDCLESHHHQLSSKLDEQKALIELLLKRPLHYDDRRSEGSSASDAKKEDQPGRRRTEVKKPTLFSTFTAHDFQLKMEAAGVSASQSMQVSEADLPHDRSEKWLRRVATHAWFDVFFSLVVITNAIFIGIDVQMNPAAMGPRSAFMVSIQYFYTLLFCIELAIRAIGLGKEYFCSKEWVWAVLDIFIVATSIWEVLVDTWYALVEDGSTNLESVGGLGGLKAFRIIRITRIVKTVRLMRIFRFVLALRTLVHSILHTLKALFWALVLLFLIVYVFALIFTQAVNGYIFDPAAPQLPPEELEVSASFYGSLTDTMISLFMSVADGLSWEKIYRPLGLISPIWSFFFLFYICFVYFAVLNVLTAVFCQSAIESAQHDHATAVQNMMANKEMHLKKIRTLFNQLGTDESGSITFGQFESKIHSPEVREYFETLGLDVEDAWSFFKLLDRDGGGSVEIGEFLKGCLRFRGQARAIDIGQLLHDQGWLLRHQSRFHTYMEMEHQKLMEQISSLKDLLTGSAGGTPRQRSRRPDKEQSLRNEPMSEKPRTKLV